MLEIGHSWSISMILRLETFSSHVNFNGNWHYVLKKVITDFHGLVSWKQQILWTTCLLNLILRIFLELGISSFSKEAGPRCITYISHQDSQSRKISIEEILNDMSISLEFKKIRIFSTLEFDILESFKLLNFVTLNNFRKWI